MTTPSEDDVAREITETAFGIIDMIRTKVLPEDVPDVYKRLRVLIAKHGTRALGLVWLIWARLISLGLDESGKPDTALYAELDGDPDLAYVRRAVVLARQGNGDGMAELVEAAIRDEQRHRTGASIEVICSFLSVAAAVQYGRPTKPTHHE